MGHTHIPKSHTWSSVAAARAAYETDIQFFVLGVLIGSKTVRVFNLGAPEHIGSILHGFKGRTKGFGRIDH